MKIYGVDVSSYQSKPDWKKAKSTVEFAILRVTEKNGVDSSFEHNYKGCKANGIPVGAYKYSYATNAKEIKTEAEGVIAALAGRGLEFPVWLDLEWNRQRILPKSVLSAMVKTFRAIIVSAGYKFGIYCNADWYKNVIPDDCKAYEFWIASYPSNDTGVIAERLRPSYGVGWQYSSKGKVPGITGEVDMDVFYKDYTEDTSDFAPTAEKGEVAEKKKKALQWMLDTAVDQRHGYSQQNRWGPDYDCSSAVITAYEQAGVPVKSSGATYTGDMVAPFLANGFIDVTSQCNLTTGAGIEPSDVLINEYGRGTSGNGHAAMYAGNGKIVHARGQSYGSSQTGDQGTEFAVTDYRNYPWDRILRYIGGASEKTGASEGGTSYMFSVIEVRKGSSGNDVKLLQTLLKAAGCKGADKKALVIDGDCGTNTESAIKKYQKKKKLTIDGIAGQETWSTILIR